jgi:hypothetical protein
VQRLGRIDPRVRPPLSPGQTEALIRAPHGRRLGRPDDAHQRSSGSNQACGPLPDISADDVEHQVNPADVFQGIAVEVDEILRAEVERFLAVGGTSSVDDVASGNKGCLVIMKPSAIRFLIPNCR